MFETMTLTALQQYWWIIISLLGAILVFLMFVQGGQTLLFQVAKNEGERTLLVNALGRKWELTFTTLVTFGGAFFASFPLFYATSFGGAYWVWAIILFGFIAQAVSYEYRKKVGNVIGAKVYEIFQIANGFLATFFIGIIVSSFFSGSFFLVDKFNLSAWMNNYYGLDLIFNTQNISLGLALFCLTRVTGSMFFMKYIDNKEIAERSANQILINGLCFLLFFLLFIGILFTKDGFAIDSNTGKIYMEPLKYLHNIMQMPIILALFLVGVLVTIFGIYKGGIQKSEKSFWITIIGIIPVVFSLFILAGLNNTSFYPSTYNLQSSLTIFNASSSKYTLTIMSYVTLFIPVVIVYVVYIWRVMSKKKINKEELEETGHIY